MKNKQSILSDIEFVYVLGYKEFRYRCPECGRSVPDDYCVVHSDVESVDITKDAKVMLMVQDTIYHLMFQTNIISLRDLWFLTNNYTLLKG